jgi:2-polyprenyl-6-methoxyphenol hydroxylase-like FAD-dependent oxidoreductase
MDDVIVIGGGPVGFINALGLAQAGVRVSVIEAEPRIIRSPRAAVYFWSLAAVVLEGADDEVLDRYAAARRDIFVNRVSPQATANKRLVFHANGGGRELEEALAVLRRLSTDAEFCRQRLMFTKSLETPPLVGAPKGGLRR